MGDQARDAVRIGCAALPPGLSRAHYFSTLGYLETADTFFDLPKASVLRKHLANAPTGSGFGLVANQLITHPPGPSGYKRMQRQVTPEELAGAGQFRDTATIRKATKELAQASNTLGSEVVLFRSATEFAPSADNRDRLAHYFTEIATAERFGDAVRVWEPQGLWELEDAAKLAAGLDLAVCTDPLAMDPLGDVAAQVASLPCQDAYFRVTGLGRARSRFDDHDALELLELAFGYRRTWFVFDHPDGFRHAAQMQRLLSAAGALADQK